MGFWSRLFGKEQTDTTQRQVVSQNNAVAHKTQTDNDQWEELPFFIPNEDDNGLISVIATSIAAGNEEGSSFVVKKIMKKNPETQLVAIIAASIAAGVAPDSQFIVKKIYQRK